MLSYIVLEYVPRDMDGRWDRHNTQPVRIDGHYADQKDAEGVAELWAGNPMHEGTRIVVVALVTDVKRPEHWKAQGE